MIPDSQLTVLKDKFGNIRYVNEFGQLHRDEGPAVIETHGKKIYYQHGSIHREDGPAVIDYDGSLLYYRYGELHRDEGPAQIVKVNEVVVSQSYYRYGQLHREDGPALMWDTGSYQFYNNGQLHNDNGPACHYVHDDKDTSDEYWLNNRCISKTTFELRKMVKQAISLVSPKQNTIKP